MEDLDFLALYTIIAVFGVILIFHYAFDQFSPLRYATMIWQLKRNGLSVVGMVQSSRTITVCCQPQYFLTVSVNNDDSNDFVASVVIERSLECIVDANMNTRKKCMIQEYTISSKILYNQAINTSLIEMLVDPTTFSSPRPVALPASEMDRFFQHTFQGLLILTYPVILVGQSIYLSNCSLVVTISCVVVAILRCVLLLL